MLARHCFQLIARFLGLWLANENASFISAECAGILQSFAKFLTSRCKRILTVVKGTARRSAISLSVIPSASCSNRTAFC